MKEQIPLFDPSRNDEPTPEALGESSTPTLAEAHVPTVALNPHQAEALTPEETLASLEAEFKIITGHNPSNYDLTTLEQLKPFVETLRKAASPDKIRDILLAHTRMLDQAERQHRPKDRYWDN